MNRANTLPWLERAARAYPERLAVVAGDTRLSYAQLRAEVERRAALLAQRGVGPATRVGLLADNSLEWLLAAHAIFWRGAALVPLHARATRSELATMGARVQLHTLITDRSDLASAIPTAMPPLSLTELQDAPEEPLQAQPITLHDPLIILFTSGTTGTPSAVPLSAANIDASAQASAERLGTFSDDRWLCCLPLSHMGGLATLLRCVIYGTCVELSDGFDEAAILQLLAERPITLASLVPTMVHRLLRHGRGRIHTSLRAILVGGGPVDATDLRAARRRGLPVLPTYGMSEAASQITTLPLDAPDEALASAGRPLPGTELRIVDEAGLPVAPGNPGSIEVRGPTLCTGYLGDDTPPLRDAQGWMRTGDVGHLDERGFLFVHHRASERIVSGGENIDPREVERVLRSLNLVSDACAFAIDHPEWGQELCCALVLADPSLPSTPPSPRAPALNASNDSLQTTLLEHCRQSMAPFKIPRRWFLIDELPRTASGKVRRRDLVSLANDNLKHAPSTFYDVRTSS
ncbi:o-succinylbenzoate--CoA ligase [Lujinxingia litoralis]|uniref:O-succinylbenzoate--CoA ligase n=1 Tax=Lujinxingia litoralis TaxID=2211119 RepID=A0A328C6V4_9DELT|nr:class I adenylate-forming enzyme family protein [Lujinxingia litoralis]RAL23675.1 o-succinylbenzoate--CoA ligase [Lujinxingia litoralis]